MLYREGKRLVVGPTCEASYDVVDSIGFNVATKLWVLLLHEELYLSQKLLHSAQHHVFGVSNYSYAAGRRLVDR
jgi:hypothetical protein